MRARQMPLMFSLAAMCVGGCATIPQYGVSIQNVAHAEIDHSNVSYEVFSFSGGVLPPGIWAYHGLVQFPIPDTATVAWTTADGVQHRKDVDLKSVPKDFSGEIRFEIDDRNNVKARIIPRKK